MAVCIIPNFEQKSTKKVLYKHINSAVLQAAEDPSEITLRYLTGQAELFLAARAGLGLLNDSACANKYLRHRQACCTPYKAVLAAFGVSSSR